MSEQEILDGERAWPPVLTVQEWERARRDWRTACANPAVDAREMLKVHRRNIAYCNFALPLGYRFSQADVGDLRAAGLHSLAARLACYLPPLEWERGDVTALTAPLLPDEKGQWGSKPPHVAGAYWCRLESPDFTVDFPVSVHEDGTLLTFGHEAVQHVRDYSAAQWHGPIHAPA
jgi:hypothetical protein